MSPRERSAWIRLASILIVFVPYFVHVLRLFQSDGPIGRSVCIAFIVAVIVHGLVNGVAQAIARLAFGVAQTDERDAAIDAKSLRIAYFSLTTLILLALTVIAFLGAISPLSKTGTILLPGFSVTSQFVLFCFVAAEVLRHATQVFCYRREAAA